MKTSTFVALSAVVSLMLPVMAPPVASAQTAAPAPQAENRLIFVTIDGVRWQELFRGADLRIADDVRRTPDPARIRRDYGATARPAETLTPFLHGTVARGGLLAGDRDHNSCLRVGNRYWFSYPGYNEMLTGRTDGWANTNDSIVNPDVTFLEWLNHLPAYAGKVRVYAAWDNFRNILNQKRSGIPVNDPVRPLPATAPKGGDARVQALALQSLRTEDSRVLFVGFAETDHFGHEGRYDAYLDALHTVDGYIRQLWEAAQSNPAWAGRTTLIVTTDHGRGLADLENENWRRHGSGFDASPQFHPEDSWPGSDQTWAAYLGPRAVEPAVAQEPTLWPCPTSSQLTASAIEALGLSWQAYSPKISPPLVRFRKP